MKYELDAACMKTREEAHNHLKERLNLPEYYGKNLDALYDCLTDMEDTQIEISNLKADEESYAARILQVLKDSDVEYEVK